MSVGKKHAIAITSEIILLIIVSILLVLTRFSGHITNLTKIDAEGRLYYADYVGDYYDEVIQWPAQFLRTNSCTAFMTHNENGDVVTGRNYDYPHFDSEGNLTTLNLVLHTHPEGKYEAIGLVDVAIIADVGLPYYNDALSGNMNWFMKLPLGLTPYITTDGINEKGLSISIMAIDTKEGEAKTSQKVDGLPTIIQQQLLRYILDSCATVDEAVELAKQYNVYAIEDMDYHLLVTDANGDSIVLEWRYNELRVIDIDVLTNFYVASDDAEDCYYPEGLKEAWTGAPDTAREYHYGYGHGYERFKTIVRELDDHIINEETFETQMTNSEIVNTLAETTQTYRDELTSSTNYSAVYNNTKRTVELYLNQDYGQKYLFAL